MGVGEDTKKVRGKPQSGGNILQGGHTGGTHLWLGDLVNFSGDGGDYGGDTHRVYEADHEEGGAAEGRRDVGEYQGGSSSGSCRNLFENDLHPNKAGYSVIVSGAAADF